MQNHRRRRHGRPTASSTGRRDQPSRRRWSRPQLDGPGTTAAAPRAAASSPGSIIYPTRRSRAAHSGWGTFYYAETIARHATSICTARYPAARPNAETFYAQGGTATAAAVDAPGTLAADLQAAMNNATCSRRGRRPQHATTVTYDAATGVFTFTRTDGTDNCGTCLVRGPTPAEQHPGRARREPRATRHDLGGATAPFTTESPRTRSSTGDRDAGTTDAALGGAPLDTAARTRLQVDRDRSAARTTSRTTSSGAARALERRDDPGARADGQVCGDGLPDRGRADEPADAHRAGGGRGLRRRPRRPRAFTFGGGAFYTATPTPAAASGRGRPSSPATCSRPRPRPRSHARDPSSNNELPFDADGHPPTHHDGAGRSPTGVPRRPPATSRRRTATLVARTTTLPADRGAGDIKGHGRARRSRRLASRTSRPLFGTTCWHHTGSRGVDGGRVTTGHGRAAPYRARRRSSDHKDPKEKTIVLFVTDGDDTCARGPSTAASDLQRAARPPTGRSALYEPHRRGRARLPRSRPTSSATAARSPAASPTASTGSPGAAAAWRQGRGPGDSRASSPTGSWQLEPTTSTAGRDGTITDATERAPSARPATDAFIAPDAATLATQLQAIIDQGASDGDFTAQQSITETVFEYVDTVRAPRKPTTPAARPPATGRSSRPASSRASRSPASRAS